MSFGFGPGADMSKAHKSNLDQLKKKKSLKELNKEYQEKAGEKPKFVKASTEKLEAMKQELQAKRKVERRQALILGILFFAIAGGLTTWLLFG